VALTNYARRCLVVETQPRAPEDLAIREDGKIYVDTLGARSSTASNGSYRLICMGYRST
jgi:hypothetical protein